MSNNCDGCDYNVYDFDKVIDDGKSKQFEFYSDDVVIGVLDTVTGRTFNSFEIVDKLNELNDERMMYKTTIDKRIVELQEEKDSLVAVIDENLLKGYHEKSLKHKEAKEKMECEDERMDASIILDVVFYWDGYIKALEELKERVSDE